MGPGTIASWLIIYAVYRWWKSDKQSYVYPVDEADEADARIADHIHPTWFEKDARDFDERKTWYMDPVYSNCRGNYYYIHTYTHTDDD